MSLRILITNDDGIDAPGIQVMREIARQLSDDIWIVAPDGNQSGASHRFTFGRELEIVPRGEGRFAVPGGSPADCVVAGMTHLCRDKLPDVVLSGVNNGQNLGDIINCSGTAAGAREGTLQGAIGIAMSQGVDYEAGLEVRWDNARRYGAEVVRAIVEQADGRDTYYNVNFPFCPPEQVSGIEVVAMQRFSRSPMRYYASDNPGRFFIAIPETPQPLDAARDFHTLLHSNAITVTPLSLDITDAATVGRLKGRLRLS
ncbi:MAG TPA: 5'/3'-nucleotidase SurE [Alphaproteobacteria bacterium]|nr:5'/3'-nucleotidase SurE [Alphaproteobacteria bacterium]